MPSEKNSIPQEGTIKMDKIKIESKIRYVTDTTEIKVNGQVIVDASNKFAKLFLEGLKKSFDAAGLEYEATDEPEHMNYGDYYGGWMD